MVHKLILFLILTKVLYPERIQDYSWESFLAQGEEHYKAMRFENAFYYFEKAIRWLYNEKNFKNPNLPKLYFLAGESLRQLRREYDAIPYYEQSLYFNKNQPDIYLILGKYYYGIKNFEKVVFYLGEYLKLKKEDREMALLYSYALARHYSRQKAESYLNSLPPLEQKNCENLVFLIEKENCFRENLLANPKDGELHLRLLRFYEEINQTAKQEQIAEGLYVLFGDKKEYALPFILTLYQRGKIKKAIGYLEELCQNNPNDTELLYFLSDLYQEISEKDKAIQYRERAQSIEQRK